MKTSGVLARDVDTQWGTYASGLPVEVLDSETNAAGVVVVLSQLGGRRLTARVPDQDVRRCA